MLLTTIRLVFASCLLSFSTEVLVAQSSHEAAKPDTSHATRAGKRSRLSQPQEIAMARSAAPASISANARVLAMTDTGYETIAAGSAPVTCVVNRSWSRSVEPQCYDSEAVATVMPVELRRNYLRHRGKSEAFIEADIRTGYESGKYRAPGRPALTYMMSGAQVLYDDDGSFVGRWRPHLMIYYPNLTNAGFGLPSSPDMKVGMVSEEGTRESTLVIVMNTFVDVQPPRTP